MKYIKEYNEELFNQTINNKKEGIWKDYIWYPGPEPILHSEISYKNDKYHGKYVIYNDNGTIKVIGNYINGKRERLWKEYNNKGDLIREGIYKNGILNK